MLAYRTAIAHFFDVRGRTSRSAFWFYVLQASIITTLAQLVDWAAHLNGILIGLVSLFHLLPGITIQIRRLHDTGRSGWWLLLVLTVIGVLPLLIWLCMRGDTERNRFDMPEFSRAREPEMGQATLITSPGGLGLAGDQVRMVPQRSSGRAVLKALLVCAGLLGGIALMMDANGVSPLALFSSQGPSCSSETVTSLVAKIIKNNLAKDGMASAMNLDGAVVRIEAVRTQGATERASECAAHITVEHLFKPPFDQLEQLSVQKYGPAAGIDIRYKAELTDDRDQVYVTVLSDTQ